MCCRAKGGGKTGRQQERQRAAQSPGETQLRRREAAAEPCTVHTMAQRARFGLDVEGIGEPACIVVPHRDHHITLIQT